MMRNLLFGGLLTGFLLIAGSTPVQAQVFAAAPPIASYYTPPPPVGVYLPGAVPVTTYYAPPVTYYPIASPTVSYFAPSAAIVGPANVRYGVFGRTIVRTPFYKVRY